MVRKWRPGESVIDLESEVVNLIIIHGERAIRPIIDRSTIISDYAILLSMALSNVECDG